ncbi:hypothetical protein COLO4_06879 [Corchorus olitorius]|uniref:Uncharacterized protein n=1 Tax=Corchorus olitorius TaxID=93759 RepID=A0A1R3KLM5_9ROSI|nr:hypothetical protein COLO4_06879 [Corchorus olitorius]
MVLMSGVEDAWDSNAVTYGFLHLCYKFGINGKPDELLKWYAIVVVLFHLHLCGRSKKDEMLLYKLERIPLLEEQVRKIREGGKLLTMDIHRLLQSEDNRFDDFVNDVAAEAKEYIESNRDEYGGTKKAIFHVLSNRVNDYRFYRQDAYAESDPFKPGPS